MLSGKGLASQSAAKVTAGTEAAAEAGMVPPDGAGAAAAGAMPPVSRPAVTASVISRPAMVRDVVVIFICGSPSDQDPKVQDQPPVRSGS